ncbi:nuclear envelope integral membrane protein 1-like [Nilaparvata lugens]|uniref:nuclear envelope integral membrane protein 1-like n=1 Tax=Nilaparvata lugens TaxID=108931 RepID=UPI00193CB006|nr:nuclear envelope integral membrane protein 1-like [Nilaparvata lugens]
MEEVDYWRVVQFVLGILLFVFGPRLSKNVFFYYVCGITFGVGASFLILVYFMSRLFPKRPLMYGFFLGGSAITFYAFQLMMDNVRTISMLYKEYVIGYFFTTSLISFIVCYRFGPVSDPRSINLIKWCLQGAALVSIFMCSYFQEAVLGVDLLLLVTYNIPKSWFISIITLMKRFRPTPKRKLLSEDEYHEQGARETARALDELRGYCSSPDCDQWRVMTRLKNPIRKRFRPTPKRKLLSEDEYHEQGARETARALDELRGYCSSPDCDQWKRFRPTPKRKLLSEDEYHEQGARETARALDELRGYCSSPDCDQWRVMTRLKNPIRLRNSCKGRRIWMMMKFWRTMSIQQEMALHLLKIISLTIRLTERHFFQVLLASFC